MRRLLALALLAAGGLVAAGCSTSPCQKLGEKLCGCTGVSSSNCQTEVENQLKAVNETDVQKNECQMLLDRCEQPTGTDFCEWLRTETGKIACGIAPDPATITTAS